MGGGVYFGSLFKGVKSIMTKRARWQKHEAAGHIVSAARKHRNDKDIRSGHQTSRVVPVTSSSHKAPPPEDSTAMPNSTASLGTWEGHFRLKPQQRQIL